jgi:hypothetical protein
MSACATTSTIVSLKGNVIAYNSDGTILRKWDNVIIEEKVGELTTQNSLKTFGLNFYDNQIKKNVIITNAVPCIIEYDVIKKRTYEYSKEELLDEYNTLIRELAELNEQLKKLNKAERGYELIKNRIKTINSRIIEIDGDLYYNYGINVSNK